jgi:hypothetical protein
MTDDSICIATALKIREAIAASDGSFKDEYGSAAWVIEGGDSQGRIIVRVIAPQGVMGPISIMN